MQFYKIERVSAALDNNQNTRGSVKQTQWRVNNYCLKKDLNVKV